MEASIEEYIKIQETALQNCLEDDSAQLAMASPEVRQQKRKRQIFQKQSRQLVRFRNNMKGFLVYDVFCMMQMMLQVVLL